MMRPISLELTLFRDHSQAEMVRSQRIMLMFLEAMVYANVLHLEDPERSYPALYESGVVYEEELHGYEEWQDIPTTLAKGVGDCEDLATYRCAELRAHAGIDAHPFLRWREVQEDGERSLRYHALVLWPDGRVEDPSRVLGMGGRPVTKKPIFVDPNYEFVRRAG